jgi:hypothetical protein
VGWLTAVILTQWDATRTDRLMWTGRDLSETQAAIDAAKERAVHGANAILLEIDERVRADWDHPDDPFAAWPRGRL